MVSSIKARALSLYEKGNQILGTTLKHWERNLQVTDKLNAIIGEGKNSVTWAGTKTGN